MKTRMLGDIAVSSIGMGAMPFTTSADTDEPRSTATLHAALDAGVTLIDTADAYAPPTGPMGLNEEYVARALAAYPGPKDHVIIATKGGHTRDANGGWGLNGRPEYLRSACEESLRRLGVDVIDLYQHHRPDPDVPYADTLGGLRDLVDAGLVRSAGISNADVDQIMLARTIVGDALVSVQNQFSPGFRSSEPEITLCADLGLAFLPWSPLGGIGGAKGLGTVHDAFASVASDRGVSPQQVCLAWELGLNDCVIPIPGASRPASISDSAQAADLQLTDDEVARLSSTVPAA